MDYAPLLWRALRAIGFADVRSGILPPRSGFRRNDEQKQSFLVVLLWRSPATLIRPGFW
jgi:hypothetical protein